MRLRHRLTFANIVSVCALVIAVAGAGGGAAYAHGLIGSSKIKPNAVKTWHVKNNNLKSADIKNNNLTSADIKDGTVQKQDLRSGLRGQIDDATSPWETIPSGRTVTGRYLDRRVAPGPNLIEHVNLPARAPVPLTQADLIVTEASGNATCTGTTENPTAPPGKVCVYAEDGPSVAAGTWDGDSDHDRHAFYILLHGLSAGAVYQYWGSWAYTAP